MIRAPMLPVTCGRCGGMGYTRVANWSRLWSGKGTLMHDDVSVCRQVIARREARRREIERRSNDQEFMSWVYLRN